MFGHNTTHLPYDYSPEEAFPPPPLFLPPLAIPELHDSVMALRSESGCSSYGGSPTSITSSYGSIPRTHSLHNNMEVINSSPPTGGFFECETTSVRKVLSAGDLQMQNQRSSSPLINENSIIESMSRANPYSPEEKKERIERYRSKRNLRNFNKKIKYECRKTLADSRPRIRGRFARNDEIEKTPQRQWDNTFSVEEDDDDDHNWIHFLDAFSANVMP